MSMNKLVLRYSPDITELLNTFDQFCNMPSTDYDTKNNYLYNLIKLEVLYVENGVYCCGQDWSFLLGGDMSTKRNRIAAALCKISFVHDVIEKISIKKSCTLSYLQNEMQGDSATIRTILDWLVSLQELTLSGDEYSISTDGNEYDDADVHSYGIFKDDLNIKDDKYSVFEYIRRIKRGSINLHPDFQRNLVWKVVQKSKFIESALMNLPLPPIFLKRVNETQLIVVDGLQRSATLQGFMNNEFELCGLESFKELNGCRFKDLDSIHDGLCARLEDRQLNMYVMQSSVPMSVVYDVFNRINTGGTQLSRQEIRNCVLQGKATQLLADITKTDVFKRSIDHGIKPLRMKDREVMLRCLAFAVFGYKQRYNGSMDDFLEHAMEDINKMEDSEIAVLKSKSLEILSFTTSAFGYANFRIPTDYTRGRINIAVMESVFYAFYKHANGDNLSALKTRFSALLKDNDYINSVRWSTSTKNQVLTRFDKAQQYLFNVQR